jgi:hypothetical protein
MNRVFRNLSALALALSAMTGCASANDADPGERGSAIEAVPDFDLPVHICSVITCYYVTNTNDSGAGSLRQAILDANAHGGARVMFDIPGNGTPDRHIIQPFTPLPALAGGVHVDGYSQAEAERGTETSPPELKVVVNGAFLFGPSGLKLQGDYNTVSGLVINGFSSGSGILVEGDGNVIRGNYIGITYDALYEIPNQTGVHVSDGTSNTLGGLAIADRNVIGGNGADGVLLSSDGNFVYNNAIGTSFEGALNLGNGRAGVDVQSDGNQIGGTEAGEGNIIAFNEGDGVVLHDGTGSVVSRNSIFDNGGLGIDLDADGVTAHDGLLDPDVGPNNLQNFPRLESATRAGDKVTVDFLLQSTANTQFRVEFYQSSSCDASGHGEGKTFVGSRALRTSSLGEVQNVWQLPGNVEPGMYVTAIAVSLADGNTSEFSRCLQAL